MSNIRGWTRMSIRGRLHGAFNIFSGLGNRRWTPVDDAAARTLPKTASRRNARKWRDVAGFSAASGVDRGAHARQLPGSRPELGLALHLPHVPFHLKTGEPFHVAWKVDIHSHALLLVGG